MTANPKRRRNPHLHAVGPEVAKTLERTQINKFHTKGGTGFAAEEANALNDRLRGRKVVTSGTDNSLNGPDRIVDGVPIQTKYFDTPSKTLNSAFSKDGYRYGQQLLEVPHDQYEDCVALMRKKIVDGKVPGVTDPAAASDLVRKGDYSYRQARNIARAGNLDSLSYDLKSQSVSSTYAFAISFAINVARLTWEGKDLREAAKGAVGMALQSGATSLVTGIATSQILRTRAAAFGAVVMRDGVKVVARTELGKSAIQKIAEVSLGKAVYGAAAVNHVAKLLRTNVVTSAVTTVVISAPDFYRAAISGSVSWAQFSKNLMVNGAGVAGGAGGWMGGAAVGAAVGSAFPVVGTAICGFIGGMLGAMAGGAAASAGSKYLLDGLIEDDAEEMVRILPGHLEVLCFDYLLSQTEVDQLVAKVKAKVDASWLRAMYQSADRGGFVYQAFEMDCDAIVAQRASVKVPAAKVVQKILNDVAKDVAKQACQERQPKKERRKRTRQRAA
jgi:hypothetical protein